jgi:predicted dehydrogenase
MSQSKISRRGFQKAVSTVFAFTYIPRRVWGANDRFYVAGIGVGGKGAGEVKDLTAAGGTFVALCDVDANRAAKTYQSLPNAKIYKDFRVMLEKEKGIDAVTVSTPDHTHAIASLSAMALGKHVYCQKPLTYSIHEARLMARAAEHYKVKTQMGNQAHANEPIRRAVELIRAGVIGPVREVHAWTNRPIWPQGAKALQEREDSRSKSAPSDLDWDLWLGPAKMRDFNPCYLPFKWRGWWEFGTGAVGDMACHIMDMPYWALDLGAPISVEGECGGLSRETAPDWSTITYRYGARKQVGGGTLGASVGPVAAVEQPDVKFVWYDGQIGSRQNAPYELLAAATSGVKNKVPDASNTADEPQTKRKKTESIDSPSRWDLIMVGDRGMMLFNRGNTEWILSDPDRASQYENVPRTLPRVKNEDVEWVEWCRGGSKALSSFDYAGPFTEAIVLGTLALRLGKKLEWDPKNLKCPNAPEADALIRRENRSGWEFPVSDDLIRS